LIFQFDIHVLHHGFHHVVQDRALIRDRTGVPGSHPRFGETGAGIIVVANIDANRQFAIQFVAMADDGGVDDAEGRRPTGRHRLQSVSRHGEQGFDRLDG